MPPTGAISPALPDLPAGSSSPSTVPTSLSTSAISSRPSASVRSSPFSAPPAASIGGCRTSLATPAYSESASGLSLATSPSPPSRQLRRPPNQCPLPTARSSSPHRRWSQNYAPSKTPAKSKHSSGPLMSALPPSPPLLSASSQAGQNGVLHWKSRRRPRGSAPKASPSRPSSPPGRTAPCHTRSRAITPSNTAPPSSSTWALSLTATAPISPGPCLSASPMPNSTKSTTLSSPLSAPPRSSSAPA